MNDGFQRLYDVIIDRKERPVPDSYTCYLFGQGLNKILKKCGEECSEVIIAAKDGEREALKEEICDLLYHLAVLMAVQGIEPAEIADILERRSAKIGNRKAVRDTERNS